MNEHINNINTKQTQRQKMLPINVQLIAQSQIGHAKNNA